MTRIPGLKRTSSENELDFLKSRPDSPRKNALRQRFDQSLFLKGRQAETAKSFSYVQQISGCFKVCLPSNECISRVPSCFQRCFELQGRAGLNNPDIPYNYWVLKERF